MSFNIAVQGGASVRLPTAGKYCEQDIVVTAPGGDGVQLPELTNPGTEADLREGKQLIDGDGNIVTGTIKTKYGGFTAEVEPVEGQLNGKTCVSMGYTPEEPAYISPSTGGIYLKATFDKFGDAQASDVTAGKTFTSAAGLLAVGTKQETALQEKAVEVTENGTVEVTPDEGYALSKVAVTAKVPVPDGYIQPSGTKGITENGTHDVTEYSAVDVNVPVPAGYILPSGTLEVTENGEFDVTGMEKVTVAVPEREVILQSKSVTPSTEQQTVVADEGYDGLDAVTVEAMPTAEQATPSITVSTAGKITATATQDAGYVEAGTKTATQTLSTQASKTVTPTTAKQTAVAKGKYTTGAVYVAGDANLLAENIKSGVSIFGVTGSAEILPDGITKLFCGTYTPTEDKKNVRVQFPIGEAWTPTFAILYADGYINYDTSTAVGDSNLAQNAIGQFTMLSKDICSNGNTYGAQCIFVKGYNASSTAMVVTASTASQYFYEGGFQISCTTSYFLQSGITYHWIAGVAANV